MYTQLLNFVYFIDCIAVYSVHILTTLSDNARGLHWGIQIVFLASTCDLFGGLKTGILNSEYCTCVTNAGGQSSVTAATKT